MTFSGSVLRLAMALTVAVTGVTVVSAAPAEAQPGLAQTAAAVPGPARIGTVYPRDGAALVTWLGPEQYNPLPPTGFRIETWTGGSLVGSTTVGNEYWTTITGLTNGTAYTFTVAATNSVGYGPASAHSASVVPHEAPGAPSHVEVTPGDGFVGVRYSAPASDGGGAIDGYYLRLLAGGAPIRHTYVGLQGYAELTGLTNGTAYVVEVSAGNDVGYGPSTSSGPVTPRTVPTAPPIGAVTAAAGSATVRWSPPSSDGGAAITRYTVRVYRGSSLVQVVYPTGNATSVQVTGLANGSAHTFIVQAHNAAGAGPVSARSAAVTPLDRPSAPQIGVTTPTNGGAIVRWSPPVSNGGSAIRAYVVRTYRGTTLIKQTNVSATTTRVLINGLTNGLRYTFTVTALNGVGWGPASAQAAAVPRR